MPDSTAPRSAGPPAASASAPAPAGERSSASLLVRCWLEPAAPGQPPTRRGYVKNLKTGEELYIKDLDAVGEQILRTLDPNEARFIETTPARAAAIEGRSA